MLSTFIGSPTPMDGLHRRTTVVVSANSCLVRFDKFDVALEEPIAAQSTCWCRSEFYRPISENKKGASREIGRDGDGASAPSTNSNSCERFVVGSRMEDV